MYIIWDGITQTGILNANAEIRHLLADAAKTYDWARVLELISKNRELINTTRPSGTSLYAPLHQAAHGGASVEVIDHLLGYGAWRTLQNARGERPIDVAERQGHLHLLAKLKPQHKQQIPMGILLKIQTHFHTTILGRAKGLVQEHRLRLPELEPLLELDKPHWFPIPGMCGGFSYWFEVFGVEARLVSISSCRVFGGSGQRHVISSAGSKLVEEGFD